MDDTTQIILYVISVLLTVGFPVIYDYFLRKKV